MRIYRTSPYDRQLCKGGGRKGGGGGGGGSSPTPPTPSQQTTPAPNPAARTRTQQSPATAKFNTAARNLSAKDAGTLQTAFDKGDIENRKVTALINKVSGRAKRTTDQKRQEIENILSARSRRATDQ